VHLNAAAILARVADPGAVSSVAGLHSHRRPARSFRRRAWVGSNMTVSRSETRAQNGPRVGGNGRARPSEATRACDPGSRSPWKNHGWLPRRCHCLTLATAPGRANETRLGARVFPLGPFGRAVQSTGLALRCGGWTLVARPVACAPRRKERIIAIAEGRAAKSSMADAASAATALCQT
jgi:hypothetical protein